MTGRIRQIVVGVAEIHEEDPHLAPAIELATALGATLHVVHAFSLPDTALYPYPGLSFFTQEAVDDLRERAHAQLELQVRSLSQREDIHCRTLPVPADLSLLEVANEVGADLLIVGATRREGLGSKILGTTAQRVVRAATVPVLVSPGLGPVCARRILFATDLSDACARMQEQGLELASALGEAKWLVRFVFVVECDESVPPQVRPGAMSGMAEGQLTAFMHRTRSDLRSGIEGKVRMGRPSREILAEANEWEADLLVLGTHGRRGASRFLIGRVAESVLRRAPCAVLVIPTGQPATGAAADAPRAGVASAEPSGQERALLRQEELPVPAMTVD